MIFTFVKLKVLALFFFCLWRGFLNGMDINLMVSVLVLAEWMISPRRMSRVSGVVVMDTVLALSVVGVWAGDYFFLFYVCISDNL